MHLLERWFRLSAHRTNVRTEVLGGVTTFVAMAYIIVVNPAMLSLAGIPIGPSTVATILACVFGTFLMGLYANRPFAVAPYMGENAFIVFGLTALNIPFTWQQRLGTVFLGGALFLVLSVFKLRSWLANAISPSMKHSFAVGIGLFLAMIGLYETDIITSFVTGMPPAALKTDAAGNLEKPTPPLKIGHFDDPRVLLAAAGFFLIMVLLIWRVRGAVLLGIVLTGLAGIALGLGQKPTGVFAVPWSEEYDVRQIAWKFEIASVLRDSRYWPVMLTLFLISFLDTLSTLVAVGASGDMLDEKGNFPEMEKPMVVDALSCMFSAAVGTSTSGAYIESATGVREGARTGLAAVVTGFLFALALFFLPLVQPLQAMKYAYGPALVAVGVLMLLSITKIDFNDLTEAAPALVTVLLMAFTYNIPNGLTAGLVLYPLFKIAAGRWRELNGGTIVLGVLCAGYYVYGIVH